VKEFVLSDQRADPILENGKNVYAPFANYKDFAVFPPLSMRRELKIFKNLHQGLLVRTGFQLLCSLHTASWLMEV
jgi:hypothetical protein